MLFSATMMRCNSHRPIARVIPPMTREMLGGRILAGLALILVLVLITLQKSAGTGFV